MALLSTLLGAEGVLPEAVRTLAQFETMVIQSDLPVIINLWSPTCAPCKKLAPVLIEVARGHAGRVRVVEIDTHSAEPAVLQRLGARSTPTIVIYEGGQEYGRSVGFRPRSWFDQMIDAEFGD